MEIHLYRYTNNFFLDDIAYTNEINNLFLYIIYITERINPYEINHHFTVIHVDDYYE